MADKIVINVRPYNGEYEFDIEEEPLTTLEWRWVKKISGYLPMTVNEGARGDDPDLYLAFAMIALTRAGKVDARDVLQVADRLALEPFDGTAIQYVGAPVEADADPPPVPAETPETSGGPSSRSTSDPSGSDQKPTGHPDSDPADSDRLTLAR